MSTHQKEHLIELFHLPDIEDETIFIWCTFLASLYSFKSNHSPLFWRGAGGEALSLLEKADKTVATRSTEYR